MIYKTSKKTLNDYNKKIIESENIFKITQKLIYLIIKIIVKKRVNQTQNNLLNTDKIAVFIPNLANIRDI